MTRKITVTWRTCAIPIPLANIKLSLTGQRERGNMQPTSYGPEIAQTTFLKSKFAELKGEKDEADKLVKETATMRARRSNAPQKSIEDLEGGGSHELMAFGQDR